MATDTKDWSVFAERRCDECGFDASAVDRAQIAPTLLDAASDWARVLRGRPADELRTRPSAQVWSPLEYGAHVRDVLRLFTDRVAAILTAPDPEFAGWDQEAAAIAARYNEQDPAIVAEEVAADGERVARIVDGIDDDGWSRTGSRDGREFTAEYLLRYLLHDVVHHRHDIGGPVAG
ncbi:DinB family protein [Gordonia crocea]|uniref:Methyltransferase type 12 n=1 Tax=Gordonia crocea TaxID=589162 RepID=A0A7I9UZU0_9ACTN|nr:DinB family protein [Gordonia crocea]GED98340.1 methyltransferase type 12 [Gordonia crocea]